MQRENFRFGLFGLDLDYLDNFAKLHTICIKTAKDQKCP